MSELLKMLNEVGIPFAYDHFAEGESPKPPFICYLLPRSAHFAADGRVYFQVDEVWIELYTDNKDLELEKRIEEALENHRIFYNQSETWIDSEKLYEVLYRFKMEGLKYAE